MCFYRNLAGAHTKHVVVFFFWFFIPVFGFDVIQVLLFFHHLVDVDVNVVDNVFVDIDTEWNA